MELSEILDWHLEHYPLLQAEDIYKLIYQGVLGPGHIITDREKAEIELTREVARLRPDFELEEIEPLDPEGLLVRVNLKPIASSPARLNRLLSALLQTSRDFFPRLELLNERLEIAIDWCKQRQPAQTQRLICLNKKGVLYQPRHSEIYLKNYAPAYRVVIARYWLA